MNTQTNTTHENGFLVEYIERIPCDCIEVRYAQRGTKGVGTLLSYAVYNGSTLVSHGTTEHNRIKRNIALEPLLALEQERYPNFPIHIL